MTSQNPFSAFDSVLEIIENKNKEAIQNYPLSHKIIHDDGDIISKPLFEKVHSLLLIESFAKQDKRILLFEIDIRLKKLHSLVGNWNEYDFGEFMFTGKEEIVGDTFNCYVFLKDYLDAALLFLVEQKEYLLQQLKNEEIEETQLPLGEQLLRIKKRADKMPRAKRLDINQISVLFWFLKQEGFIRDFSKSDLSQIVSILTGWSPKNIKDDNGFTQLDDILRDRVIVKSNSDGKVNYNARTITDSLKDLASKILSYTDSLR